MNEPERRIFSDSFKQQMIKVHLNGKSRADIIREYDLTPSAFNRWINQSKTTGSFIRKKIICRMKHASHVCFGSMSNNWRWRMIF